MLTIILESSASTSRQHEVHSPLGADGESWVLEVSNVDSSVDPPVRPCHGHGRIGVMHHATPICFHPNSVREYEKFVASPVVTLFVACLYEEEYCIILRFTGQRRVLDATLLGRFCRWICPTLVVG